MATKNRIQRTYRAVEGNWYRADLHLHTPASADWQDEGTTFLQWLQRAESRGLDIVAITDHNTVEGVARLRNEVERLAWLEANDRLRPQERRDLDEFRRLGDKILVLPGFEFTATFGFHVLALFPPETPLRTLELLLLRLNVPLDKLAEGSTEVGASADVLTAYRIINETGGLVIAAHANSTHGVAMRGMGFGGQTKIAYTQDPNLHALEVTDLEDAGRRATARFFDGSKPEYPRRMHCIQGSDAHRLMRDPKDKNRPGIGDRVTEVLLLEPSFNALKQLFDGDDFTRTRPYRPLAEQPFDHIEAAREQGNNIVQAFHESLSRESGRLHKVLCDTVAFANTCGGAIYIGVSASRKGAPRGVENPESAVAMLKKELERNITPRLDARVDIVQSQGAPIITVSVPNGADKPYALGQTRVYVRQEGETNEAVRDELVQLVLSGRQPVVVAEPTPAAIVAEPEPAPVAQVEAAPAPGGVTVAETAAGDVQLPAIGVEIISSEERKGTRYFTIRDLRNGNVIQNVTLASARKLWSYAINQYLTNPLDPAQVTWRGEFGLWQAARRAKKLRYDLALRGAEGVVRAFYGVTADGMVGPWQQFLRAEDKPEAESSPAQPAAAPAAPAPAKPSSRSRRSRSKPQPAAAAAPVEPVAPAPAAVETPPPAPAEAKAEAQPQPKSRSRSRKPAAATPAPGAAVEQLPAPQTLPVAAPAAVDVTPPAHDATEAVETTAGGPSAAAQPEAAPKPRSRRGKAKTPPAADTAAVEPPAPTETQAEAQPEPAPKPARRSRRSKAQAEPEAAS